MAADNKSLGRFILDGIPPAPRGTPQIEVTFDIDANGILNVSAQDKGSGKKQHITITGSSGLSEEDIEKMKKDAEKNAEEDKKKKEAVETKNQAESVVVQTEKLIKESGDKMSEEDKKKLQEKLDALKGVKDSDNMDDIKAKLDELNQVAQDVGQKMYQQQGRQAEQGQEGQAGQSEGSQDQGPVEGEYEEGGGQGQQDQGGQDQSDQSQDKQQ
jgi:molecular chaperone DnaK